AERWRAVFHHRAWREAHRNARVGQRHARKRDCRLAARALRPASAEADTAGNPGDGVAEPEVARRDSRAAQRGRVSEGRRRNAAARTPLTSAAAADVSMYGILSADTDAHRFRFVRRLSVVPAAANRRLSHP